MTTTAPSRTRSRAGRRSGHLAAVIVNAVLLYAIHTWPGWSALPFLTDQTPRVLGLVTLSVVAGLVANVLYLVRDPLWLTATGELAITAVGLAATLRVWAVFPLDFHDPSSWPIVARVLLAVAIVGSVIGLLVQLGTLVRVLAGAPSRR